MHIWGLGKWRNDGRLSFLWITEWITRSFPFSENCEALILLSVPLHLSEVFFLSVWLFFLSLSFILLSKNFQIPFPFCWRNTQAVLIQPWVVLRWFAVIKNSHTFFFSPLSLHAFMNKDSLLICPSLSCLTH